MNARPEAKHGHAHAAGCAHEAAAPDAGTRVKDPVCGMTVDPHDGASTGPSMRPHLLFLLGRLPRRSSSPIRRATSPPTQAPRPSPRPEARSTPARCIRRSARSARAPARSAAWRWSRSMVDRRQRPEPRARRHDAALLDRARADRCRCSCWRWAATCFGLARLDRRRSSRTGSSSCSRRRSCCGPAGRSSSAAGIARSDAQPQHVHADRPGHRRGLGLQRRRHAAARHLPRRVPRPRRRRSRSTSRRRP